MTKELKKEKEKTMTADISGDERFSKAPSAELLMAKLIADGVNPFLRGCGYLMYVDFEDEEIVIAKVKKVLGVDETFLEVVSQTSSLDKVMNYVATTPKVREALQSNANYIVDGTTTRSSDDSAQGVRTMREITNAERYC